MTFIPYQIDYAVTNAAKTLGFSKKKVSFKFGFANPNAQGLTGAACRGSEHEVTFIWSLASGKRQLLLDGKDVHYSESGQNGWTSDRAWQHSFPLKDNTVRQTLKVHFISQPVSKDVPGSRPFDLRVGGVSYFSFNQIFQLGTSAMTTRVGNHHTDPDHDMMTAEERRLVAQAKLESLKDYEHQRSASHSQQQQNQKPAMKHDEDLLMISFDDNPTPPAGAPPPGASAVVGGYVTTTPYQGFASSLSLDSAIQDPNSPSMMQQMPPPQQQDAYSSGYNMPENYSSHAAAPPANPYAPTYQQSPAPAPYSSSNAMTPYQHPAGAPPAPNPYPPAYPTPGLVPPPNPYAVNTNNNNNPYAAPQSPSMQSFASFGSAPSFAQPPKPPLASFGGQQGAYGYAAPPPQQQQNAYGFAAPPPQQQQNSYY